MVWASHVPRTGEKRNEYKVGGPKYKEKGQIRRPSSRRTVNDEMSFKKLEL
jgi:hypothetical protein